MRIREVTMLDRVLRPSWDGMPLNAVSLGPRSRRGGALLSSTGGPQGATRPAST